MDNKDDQPEENEESDDDILVRAEAGDVPTSLLFGGNPGGIADDDEAKFDTGEIDEKRKSVIEDVYHSRDSFPLGWMKKNYREWEADEDKTVYKVTERLISPEIIAQGLGLDNFSAPVEWMRNLRWGFHCGTCFAWWMGMRWPRIQEKPEASDTLIPVQHLAAGGAHKSCARGCDV